MDKTEIEKKNAELRKVYQMVFSSPNGKVVLEDMKDQFYRCLLTTKSNNGLSVEARAAQHDVIAQILKMIGERNDI